MAEAKAITQGVERLSGAMFGKQLKAAAPWVAGASLAVTHLAMSSQCNVPREGRCNTCGSCAFALLALASWAIAKKGSGVKSGQLSDQ